MLPEQMHIGREGNFPTVPRKVTIHTDCGSPRDIAVIDGGLKVFKPEWQTYKHLWISTQSKETVVEADVREAKLSVAQRINLKIDKRKHR